MMTATIDHLATVSQAIDLEQVCIDPRWALKLPSSFAVRKRLLPLSLASGSIYVACEDPLDHQAKQTLQRYLEYPCKLIEAKPEALDRALARVYDKMTLGDSEAYRVTNSSSDDPQNSIAICDELIQAAFLRGASDVHLVPDEQSLVVSFRVDGLLESYCRLTKQVQPLVISRFKVLAGMDIAEKRAAQDGRITAFHNNSQSRLEIRAASLPTRYGERITLRLLASRASTETLSSLGLSGCDLELFQSVVQRPHGLVLLTGPTGSGKSTTLYVTIEHLLKSRGGNVITIEDPLEYEIKGASQIEVDSADKVNFGKALRSVLRHDPDVVMIGEIRDRETADIAIKAALTGHLVFSTLHTNSAAGVVTRLIDLGVEPFLIAATLRLAVAQRLVRKLCTACHRQRTITLEESLSLQRPELQGQAAFDPVGCLTCGGKGYQGRTGLFELLENNEAIAKLIAEQANETVVAEKARRLGARSLIDDGIAKVADGTTTIAQLAAAIAIR